MSCEIYKVLNHFTGEEELVSYLTDEHELIDVIPHDSDDPDLAIEQLHSEINLGDMCESRTSSDLL
jgi:hypothetical protein